MRPTIYQDTTLPLVCRHWSTKSQREVTELSWPVIQKLLAHAAELILEYQEKEKS